MPKQSSEKKPLKVVYEPEELPTFYANVVQVLTSPYDVTIRLGRINPEKRGQEKVTISDAIQVYMSPQHARALIGVLEGQLTSYEERYGPIPVDVAAAVAESDDGETEN